MTTSTVSVFLTLSQALRRVKKLKGDLATHGQRARDAVSYPEARKPAYPFAEQMEARAEAQEELIRLEAAVSTVNAGCQITFNHREMSLAEAIRRLQETKANIAWVGGLSTREGEERETYYDEDEEGDRVRKSRTVKWVCDLPVRERDAEVRRLQEEFQALNDLVETANHTARFEVELLAPSSAAVQTSGPQQP